MSAEEMPGNMTDGFHLVVEALKLNGVDTIYGVAGIPIIDPFRTFGPAKSLLPVPDFRQLPVEALRACPDIFAARECSHFRRMYR